MKLKDSLIKFILNQKYWGIYLAIFFIVIRLPYLGFSNFNTDSFKWKARIYDFGSGVFNLNFEQTVQKYHPGVTLLWIGTFSVKVYNFTYSSILQKTPQSDSAEFLFSLNFYQILFVVLALAFLINKSYKYLSEILGKTKSLLILAIVAVDPFFLALTTTLHLDGLLNLLLLNTLLTLYLYIDGKGYKYLYLSGIYFGLSLLTKTTAILFLPIIFIAIIFKYLNTKEVSHFVKFGYFILITSLTYFILWPGMWVDPIGTLTYVLKGVTVGTDDHSQIYFGNLVNDPGPLYYLIVCFIKTPIYIFPGLLLATYRQFGTTYKKYTFELFLFLSSILYLIEITIPSKKLDRYVLTFVLLISISIISYAYDYSKKLAYSFLVINLVFVFYLRFDFFSYYNPLAGGIASGVKWIEPKWAFGQKEIAEYFSNEINVNKLEYFGNGENISKISEKNKKLVVALPEKYYTQLYPYFKLIGGWAVINEINPEARKANYFIFPVWEDNSVEFIGRYKLSYYGEIKVRDVAIFKVFKRNDR
jgi:hypothetical protein